MELPQNDFSLLLFYLFFEDSSTVFKGIKIAGNGLLFTNDAERFGQGKKN